MNSKIAFFPTVFAVAIAILGLGIPIPTTTTGTPWLVAHHQQTLPDGQTYDVDTVGFFLWGQQYTVVGTKMIQTNYIRYDFRDFPIYSFILMLIGVISGILALTVNRTYRLKLDKEYIWINKVDPVMPLLAATFATGLATYYLFVASSAVVIPALANSNYVSNYSYGIQFMAMSFVAFTVSLILTYMQKDTESDRK